MRTVPKPWGHELIWAETDRYVGKVLHIKAGEQLSLQYHRKKEETLLVWQGRLRFESGPLDAAGQPKITARELGPGESAHVTPGLVHRMVAVTDCDIFEVSTHELDDVVRLEDRYGRAGKTAP